MVMKMLNRSRSNIRIVILLLQYRNGQYASRFCLVLFSNRVMAEALCEAMSAALRLPWR